MINDKYIYELQFDCHNIIYQQDRLEVFYRFTDLQQFSQRDGNHDIALLSTDTDILTNSDTDRKISTLKFIVEF